jgi:transposase
VHNIQLHFLPAYSPNLNPIERLWKVMNEKARNNRFFKSAKEFRETIRGFFAKIPELTELLMSRITDNFHVVSAAN